MGELPPHMWQQSIHTLAGNAKPCAGPARTCVYVRSIWGYEGAWMARFTGAAGGQSDHDAARETTAEG